MEETIFTKIINGEIPCHKVYEDDKIIAFLDIHPVQTGHTLVVPKIQIDHFEDLPDEFYNPLWQAVRLISKHLRDTLKTERIGVSIVGTDVPHAHVHLIPFNQSHELHVKLDLTAEPDHEKLAELAKKLRIVGEK